MREDGFIPKVLANNLIVLSTGEWVLPFWRESAALSNTRWPHEKVKKEFASTAGPRWSNAQRQLLNSSKQLSRHSHGGCSFDAGCGHRRTAARSTTRSTRPPPAWLCRLPGCWSPPTPARRGRHVGESRPPRLRMGCERGPRNRSLAESGGQCQRGRRVTDPHTWLIENSVVETRLGLLMFFRCGELAGWTRGARWVTLSDCWVTLRDCWVTLLAR